MTTAVDLFAGAGGFSEAARRAACRVLWAGNHSPIAVQVHAANHPATTHACQDLQQADWHALPRHDLLLASPACVPATARLETLAGRSRLAAEVRVGDLVLTHEGREKPVVNVWTKLFSGPMVTLDLWNSTKDTIEMTGDHLVWVRRKRVQSKPEFREPEFMPACELRPGDYVAFPRRRGEAGTAAKFLGRASTLDVWWLLGHYLGDGDAARSTPAKPRAQVTFSVGGSAENLRRVQMIAATLDIPTSQRGPSSNRRITLSSGWLHELCSRFGHLAHCKRVPAELATLESDCVEALLRGYLAADGSTRSGLARIVWSATSVSLGLLQDLQRLCWRLGWSAGIQVGDAARACVIEGRTVNARDSWTIAIRPVPHSQSRTKFTDSHVWRSVRKVTRREVSEVPVYDFEVNEDHTFCLPGVVVHNCQGHSRGASRGGSGHRGSAPKHDTDRATAWSVISCLEVHRPVLALVENVPEFLSWTLYETWLHGMRTLGYMVSPHVLDAADFGVPQQRKRLFLVCTRSKAPLVLDLPRMGHISFGGALDPTAEGWARVSTKPAGVQGRVAKGRARFAGDFLTQHVTTHTGRSLDRPIGTVTCASHHWHLVRRGSRGDEIRPLNSLELRRAMGFPDDYQLDGRLSIDTRLLGNAVAPPCGEAVLRSLLRAA